MTLRVTTSRTISTFMDSYSYRCVWENLHEFICATCLQSLAIPEECIGPSGKSSRWLWATMWVLGIQYRSSAKATSVHNHGAAYSAQYFTFESYSENLRASWPPLSSCQLWRTLSLFGGYKAFGAFSLRSYLLLLQIWKKEKHREKGSTKQNLGRCFLSWRVFLGEHNH